MDDFKTDSVKKHKRIDSGISSLFERALLASTGNSNVDHLPSMSNTVTATKRFVNGDFSELLSHGFYESNQDKSDVIIKFLCNYVDSNPSGIDDAKKWLEDMIRKNQCSGWKKVFIEHDLINANVSGLEFKNGFEPGYCFQDYEYTYVYTTSNRRMDWGELNSFALAIDLAKIGKTLKYIVTHDQNYFDEFSFPNCYIDFGNNHDKIAFINGAFYKNAYADSDKLGDYQTTLQFLESQ